MNRQSILQTASLVAATARAARTAGVACIMLLAAACTQDELADGTILPEGKYPMTFATAVEGLTVTRANTAEGQWTEGDAIAVQVGGDVRQYTPAAGGSSSATLQAASGIETLYWQSTADISVSAWYYGTGYSIIPPDGTSWAVQSDQSGDGYQKSDFLYAPATTISFANRGSASLTFYHQTAKVVINIVKADAAIDAEQIQSVTIGNNNLALSGVYAAPGTGQTAGTWNNHANMGTIIPKSITATDSYLKSYAALVIPQNMTEEKFISVKLTDGNTYYYTPKNSDGDLQSGKQHTYNITVKGIELVVTTETSPSWGTNTDIGGDTTPIEVTSFRVTLSGSSLPALSDFIGITNKEGNIYNTSANTFSFSIPKADRKGFFIQKGLAGVSRQESGDKITYTFTNVRSDLVLGYYDNLPQVGDYYYADGTWSADYKSGTPACIGIVFKVDAGTGDAAIYYDDKLTDGLIRGYVAALKNAASGGKPAWSTEKVITGVSTSKTDFDGYRNTRIIMARNNYGTHYPAFVSCVSNNGTAAPASSSGWYMPSCAQIKALHEIRNSIGSKFTTAGGAVLSSPSDYWTSNESDGKQANYVWHYYTGDGSFWDNTQKTESNKDYVRAILTF